MRNIVLLIAWITLIPVMAQKAPTFIEVDTTTYNAYLNSDWDQIISIGNNALKYDIDYYYLRLRMGYAYFMKKRYRLAIPQYQKALKFNNNDPITQEYLYYCYQYSGRSLDAEKLVSQFPKTLKSYFEKDNAKVLSAIGFNVSYASGAKSSVKDEIIQTAPNNIEGVQKAHNNYLNYKLSLSHRIGRSVSIKHSASLLYKDEFVWSVVNSIPYLSESQSLRQFNYLLGIDITPSAGFTLSPSFSYLNYRIPVFYDYGTGQGKDREVYKYISDSDIAAGLIVTKQLGIFSMAIAGTYSEFNLSKQYAGAASISIYPFANLNLYYTLRGYYLMQNHNTTSTPQFINSHELGYKLTKHLWLELHSIFGAFTNFYDVFSGISYNSIEQYNSITSASVIVPFYKAGISFFANFNYFQSESIFIPVDAPLNTYNNIEYNYHSITGGFRWKF